MLTDEILQLEYNEQYNQYRWIGTMQSIILSLFGVITMVTLYSYIKTLPADLTSEDYIYFSYVLLILGFMGIIVGHGLLKSRFMQLRTARYLASILIQMLKYLDGRTSKTKRESLIHALNYRCLCTSKGRDSVIGSFKFIDTSNIAVFLTTFAGTSMSLVGLIIIYNLKICTIAINENSWTSIIITIIITLLIVYLYLNILANREKTNLENEINKIDEKFSIENIAKTFGVKYK